MNRQISVILVEPVFLLKTENTPVPIAQVTRSTMKDSTDKVTKEMDLTISESSVESKSVLRRLVTQKDGTFKTGKYAGRSHKEVLGYDPDYILMAYEEHHDNGGISRECYRMAQLVLEEEHEYEQTPDDLFNEFHLEDSIEE